MSSPDKATNPDKTRWNEIIRFWKEAGEKKWWVKDNHFDSEITRKFMDLYRQAANSDLDHWADHPDGCLALVILLDQFPRNMFRNSSEAFAADPKAVEIAVIADKKDYGPKVDPQLATFLFMPFMHSESLENQEKSLELQKQFGEPGNVDAARWHMDIIKRFGRFPHRNPVLDRQMSDEEQAYLDDGGFQG